MIDEIGKNVGGKVKDDFEDRKMGHKGKSREREIKKEMNNGGEGTYPIGNGTTHTGDHGNTAPVSKANHLLGNGQCPVLG